jgi:2-dehydro-3-deoxyphosphogluconate aldolase/(4S)-4-hydroxy-2-oxoglutarate aldolase
MTPYAHLGVRFIPTGGVSLSNLASYLAEPSVMAAGGTWLARQSDISNGEWDRIVANCREVCALVRTL